MWIKLWISCDLLEYMKRGILRKREGEV